MLKLSSVDPSSTKINSISDIEELNIESTVLGKKI